MTMTEPALPAIFTEDSVEPEEEIAVVDLRGLRAEVAYDEDCWPSLVIWDVEGQKIELSAGIVGWPAWRELAAEGAERLASEALTFARAIRAYRRAEDRT